MLVLKALSTGRMHGFAIALWLEEHSSGSIDLDDSITYQVLHRLEGKGWVDAEWTVTENNRRARVYRLTLSGRARLAAESEAWSEFSRSVSAILRVKPST
jgi:transcriptional regulator